MKAFALKMPACLCVPPVLKRFNRMIHLALALILMEVKNGLKINRLFLLRMPKDKKPGLTLKLGLTVILHLPCLLVLSAL